MKNIEKIKTYKEFKEQLTKLKKSQSEIILSYYKYCHLYDQDEDLGIDEANNNFQYVTNFIVTPGYYDNESLNDMKGLDRYNHIKKTINPDGTNTEGNFTKEESISLLKDLGRRNWNQTVGADSNGITVWSVLYDLDNLEATWISNEEFNNEESVFTFSL